ncbi:unnamed protein product [Strongylus vulgaris]|uniref:Uncharacterized protein n=1 Tax=Strongylus vulgaris TaxID=40348 RepID=A0A3P7I091_STRVU|nr:unnamed protein product [Strongylus vulgaris]
MKVRTGPSGSASQLLTILDGLHDAEWLQEDMDTAHQLCLLQRCRRKVAPEVGSADMDWQMCAASFDVPRPQRRATVGKR